MYKDINTPLTQALAASMPTFKFMTTVKFMTTDALTSESFPVGQMHIFQSRHDVPVDLMGTDGMN